MQLTKDQRIFIVSRFKLIHNYDRVRTEFLQMFPERNSLSWITVRRTVEKFNDHGTILNRNKGNSGRRKTGRTEENIALVANVIRENPQSTVRRNGSKLSKRSFYRILKFDLKMKPYKMQIKHQLLSADFDRRLAFSNWILERRPRFFEQMIFTDEAAFSMEGVVNTQNTRHWSIEAPEGYVYEKSIRREKVSVWAGVCGNGNVLGPFFYDATLTGDIYLEMLEDLIIPSIQEVYGNGFNRACFMQCGAPTYRRLTVKNKLQEAFGHRVMALGFDTEWPPRSPDLTPCDFYLWGL